IVAGGEDGTVDPRHNASGRLVGKPATGSDITRPNQLDRLGSRRARDACGQRGNEEAGGDDRDVRSATEGGAVGHQATRPHATHAAALSWLGYAGGLTAGLWSRPAGEPGGGRSATGRRLRHGRPGSGPGPLWPAVGRS